MNEEQELQIGLPAYAVYKIYTYPAGNRVNRVQVNEVYSVFILIWKLNVEEKLQFLRFRRPTRVNITYMYVRIP
jgi:hypothetical protein